MARTVKTCLVACVAVVTVACSTGGGGGGDDAVSDEGKPYAESLSKNLTKGGEGEIELSDEQANCIAPKWVNTMKPDRLKKAGIKPADLGSDDNTDMLARLKLSKDEGVALVDAFSDCGVNLKESFLAADSDLTDDDRNCLNDAISDDLLKEVLVIGFTKGPGALSEDSDLAKEYEKAIKKCPGARD